MPRQRKVLESFLIIIVYGIIVNVEFLEVTFRSHQILRVSTQDTLNKDCIDIRLIILHRGRRG